MILPTRLRHIYEDKTDESLAGQRGIRRNWKHAVVGRKANSVVLSNVSWSYGKRWGKKAGLRNEEKDYHIASPNYRGGRVPRGLEC
jgi:hypothetical protein